MNMKYHWARCPKCGCELSINSTGSPRGIFGSLRRWSADRSINDGRPIRVEPAGISADGGFVTACVCGQEITVSGKPDAVSAEREGDLRVTLGE
jgi:hypothetical protein